MSILSSKALSAQIKGIKSNAAKLRESIHEALISATFYAYKDGNVEPFNQILDAVGDGTRKAGITKWVELVSGIAHVEQGQFKLNKKVRNEAGITDEERFASIEEEIRKVKWFDAAPKEKVESVWDCVKVFEKEIKHLASLAKQAKAEDDHISAEAFTKAHDLLAKIINDATYGVEEVETRKAA